MVDHTPTDETILPGRNPVDVVAAVFDLEPVPAATVSAQEIAEMRERWARVVGDVPVGALDKSDRGERLGGLIGADMPRLLDAIEALTAKNQRLTDALNTTALEACEEIDDKLKPEIERLRAENARLTSERDELRIGLWEIAHGHPPANPQDAELALRLLGDDVETLTNDLKQRLQQEDDLRRQRLNDDAEADMQELADFGQRYQPETYATDDRPLSEIVADLRAVVAASPEAQAGIAAYFAEQAEERWHDGTIYNAHRSQVEAAHAAAKEDHPGIDMALLGQLCSEEPDADTKREVAEMMATILAAEYSPLADPEYPALVRMARESSKDGD